MKTEEALHFFKTPKQFRSWLQKNHKQPEAIWVQFYKKDSGVKSMVYKEALDEALCFGWVDSQVKTIDEKSYKQKFSLRRPRSVWSKRNIERIERLIKEKKMMPAGLVQYEAAKKDGRLDRAYAPPTEAHIPADLQAIINKDKKMKAFVETLNRSNINAIYFRLSTAVKPETRERRLKAIVEMLKAGKKFY